MWARGNPPYPFTSYFPSFYNFSIFYLFVFPFLSLYFLVFPSLPIIREYSHSVSGLDVVGGRRLNLACFFVWILCYVS